MESGDLRKILGRLQRRDQSGRTDMEIQFSVSQRTTSHTSHYLLSPFSVCLVKFSQVLEQVSPNPQDAKVSVALKHPKKNRSKNFLPRKLFSHSLSGWCSNVCLLSSGQVEGGDKGGESGLYQC